MIQLPLSAELATDHALLEAVDAARRLRRPPFEAELAAIAEAADVTLGELRGPSRDWRIVEVRHVAAAYLRSHGLSLVAIGRLLGRDHTTVLNLLHGKPAERARRAAV